MDLKQLGDWRSEAMDAALLCRAQDGTPDYTLFAMLLRRYPEASIRRFGENRARTLIAAQRALGPLTTQIAPAYRYQDATDPSFPLYGWWTAEKDGAEFELVLSPDPYGHGDWILVGPDAESTKAVVASIITYCEANTTRCLRYSSGDWADAPEMESEIAKITWDEIVLAPELLSDIRQNIMTFFTQKAVFHRLGFAWRRGILLVGPPGTGKTMICKAAAQEHSDVLFLYVRDFQTHGEPVKEIFETARKYAPCILAIEDIDGLLGGHNRTQFLNEMDGFKNNDGILIVASSNHPHKIDEALLKRPSRFDRVYHIGLPEKAERIEYARRTLARMAHLPNGLDCEALSAAVAEKTDGFTPAFLKEAFLSALLQLAQEGREGDADAFFAATLAQIETLRKYLKKVKNADKLGEFAPSTDGAENIGFRTR